MILRAKGQYQNKVQYDNSRETPYYSSPPTAAPSAHIQWREEDSQDLPYEVSPGAYVRKKIFSRPVQLHRAQNISPPRETLIHNKQSPQFILDDLHQPPMHPPQIWNQQHVNMIHQQTKDIEVLKREIMMIGQHTGKVQQRICYLESGFNEFNCKFNDKSEVDDRWQVKILQIIKAKNETLMKREEQLNKNLKRILQMQESEKYYQAELSSLRQQITHQKRVNQISKQNEVFYKQILDKRSMEITLRDAAKQSFQNNAYTIRVNGPPSFSADSIPKWERGSNYFQKFKESNRKSQRINSQILSPFSVTPMYHRH